MNHARYTSPSGSHLWMLCAAGGAYAGTQGFREIDDDGPLPEYDAEADDTPDDDRYDVQPGQASRVGTVVHSMLDIRLQGAEVPAMAGELFKLRDGLAPVPVTEEMVTWAEEVGDEILARVATNGYTLMSEVRVSFRDLLPESLLGHPDEGTGTADVITISPDGKHLTVEDLKTGRKPVKASYDGKPNPQLGLYALGALRLLQDLGYGEPEHVTLVIHQPSLGARDEATFPREQLNQFEGHVGYSLGHLHNAVEGHDRGLGPTESHYTPGDKQCEYCPILATCAARRQQLEEQLGAAFEDFGAEDPEPQLPRESMQLARIFAAARGIRRYLVQVDLELQRRVSAGMQIPGPDGKLLKMVRGKQGHRKWKDDKAATEKLLVDLFGERAYYPRELISPTDAEKVRKSMYKREPAVFEENPDVQALIIRSPGKLRLALGSEEGEAVQARIATNDEFQDLGEET